MKQLRPMNTSQDQAGYNTEMFKTERSVSNALRKLGYGISKTSKIPGGTVLQFQKDYNKCGDRYGHWGRVDETSELDRHTLNALEGAVRWAKMHENKDGEPSSRLWQGLCRNIEHLSCGTDRSRRYSSIEPDAASDALIDDNRYIEVLPHGSGKLKSLNSDRALRANIIDFEHHGPVIFAVAILPPQRDLPGGREDPVRCPCVMR